MSLDDKFLPSPTDVPEFHKPFWEALKERRLTVQTCENGHPRFVPTEICHKCGAQAWTWEPMSGKGRVYTYTVVHRGPIPAYQKDAPYVIAHVEMDEGVRMISNLIDVEPGDVRVGMPVEVVFEDASPEWTLYKFRPAKS
jgi:uncharacterized OB-fold protein